MFSVRYDPNEGTSRGKVLQLEDVPLGTDPRITLMFYMPFSAPDRVGVVKGHGGGG